MQAHGLTPILNVSDLPASFAWFEKFGWKKLWDWRSTPAEPLTFGAVGSGVCEIFLCLDRQGGRGRAGYDGQGVWMSVWVTDVDAEYANCQAHGIEVAMPPQNEPWGVREMHVRHPDGHMFRVSTGIPCDDTPQAKPET